MGTRGRPSAASRDIAVLAPAEITERQRPPHDLTDEETEVWVAVVSAEPADWFTVSTRPLLAQYCRHAVHARRIAEMIERVLSRKTIDVDDYDQLLRMQERESRMMTSLATKMRLTQQSTTNHRGNKRLTLDRKPWE
jgi:RecA/RadA recombinase